MAYSRTLATTLAVFMCCRCVVARRHSPFLRHDDSGWGFDETVDAVTGPGRQLLATGGFNGTILSNGTFAAGWEYLRYNGSNNIQNFSQGVAGNQALCAYLPSAGDTISFHCINCSASGRQPFWLNKTGGFQYYVTQLNDDGFENATVSRHALQLILQDDTGNQLCKMNSDDTVLDKNIDNFQHIQVLSQNYPSGNQNPPMDCRAALQTATMVGFQAQWDGVQFCVDDFEIIPSTVVTPETANASNSLDGIAPYQNCWLRQPTSVTPEGNYTNISLSLPAWMRQNIPGPSPPDGYTLFPSVDTPFRNYIFPVNGSCSIINTANLSAINTCARSGPGNAFGVCCYNATGYMDGQSGATLPSVLADMCHNMISYPANPPALGLDARCSGFAFDNATQIATFKRTNDGSTIDVPGNDEVCNVPTGVEWVRNSALPGYVAQPGGVDLGSIYAEGLQLGWNVNSTSNITLQEVPIGINGSLAMCANMPAFESAFQFTCQDCPRSQTQPFGIDSTSGFQMWIAAAQYSSSNFTVESGASPVSSMILQLQNATGIPICSLTLTATGKTDPSGSLHQATALYQNGQSCVAVLSEAASLSFVMNATAGAAVCVSNLTMLPSQVLGSGVASVAAIPQFPNCPVSSWSVPDEFVQPQNTSEGGNFTVTGYNDTTNYSVPGSSDAQTYVLYQGVDLPGSTFQRNTTANNGNCSDLATDNTTAVSVCAGQHNLCCFDSSVAGYQRGINDGNLPTVLAQLCNDLWIGKTVCQGFVYDADSGLAYFLYGQQYSHIDLSAQPTACNRPGASMWLLKGAIAGSNETDDRGPPGASGGGSGGGGANTAGTVLGILLGVASPAAGAAAWLILTYTYRQAKHRIVLGVIKYLLVEDIAVASSSTAANAGPTSPANIQMVAQNGRQPVRQASSLQRTLSTVPSSTPLTLDAAADDAVAAAQGHAPSAEMKKAASEIARQCLRQWDGFLGIHAGTDSAGAKAGVWRGKFDGVRCAVLLLAFRKMNKGLQNRSNESSCLLQAWKECKTHRQKQELARDIALVVQSIDVRTAQNLPDKDPEVLDQPRFSWRNLMPQRLL